MRSFACLFLLCSFSSVHAGEGATFEELLNRAKEAVEKSGAGKKIQQAVLSNEDIRAGLKEALSKGIKSAISTLGKDDGFLKNLDVKIPLPAEIAKTEDTLRLFGQGKRVDEFVTSMNRAAEKAVPHVADIFAEAISKMTIEDAQAILHGAPDAATQYFRKTSSASIGERFLPLVKDATDAVGVTKNYKKLADKAGPVLKLIEKDMDLDKYVTGKATDGLFFVLAQEEKKIRENPAERTTDLLRRVFGMQKPEAGSKVKNQNPK